MRITTLILLLFTYGALRPQTLTSLHHYPTHAYSIFDLYPSPMGGYLATVQVWDSIDVDPGPGAVWLETLAGVEEGAIVAYDANGGYLWHKQITSTVKVTIGNLSFTEDGQFYASGTASGTADVDPGPGVAAVTCNCNGGLNGWYGKFNATGDLLWHAQVGDGTASTQATVRLLYSPLSHDLFMFGEALGSNPTDYDPGPGWAEIPPPPVPGQGLTNFIYARLDSSGAFQWHRPWGTSSLREVTRWDDGVNEYFYLAGTSFGWPDTATLADHDPGAAQALPYHPIGTLQDAFASKFDANGDLVWCRFFFGGNGAGFGQNEGATDISVDSQGNAYLVGKFVSNYPTTVGGSPLSLVPYGGAGTDAFLLKLDGADGSLIWEKQFGSPNDDNIYDAICAVDELDRVYIGSVFVNTAELNSAGPSVQVTANGPMWTKDGFVASFNASGQYLWSGAYGGPGPDGPSQLFPSANEFCMVGYFTGTADLDLGPGVNNVAAQQGNDPFFACYDLSGLALGGAGMPGSTVPFMVHPNPARGVVYLQHTGAERPVEVFDALGQQMITTRAGTIDVSAWAEGLYIVSCDGRTQRLIVQH
ncbi:MAG: T9SS type A sorting domain-containing protein [Flavobacteriales bacterium]|nr:MAG: T9SS type A sorting domain-containing protein [Flavobacteriales bacterium]